MWTRRRETWLCMYVMCTDSIVLMVFLRVCIMLGTDYKSKKQARRLYDCPNSFPIVQIISPMIFKPTQQGQQLKSILLN